MLSGQTYGIKGSFWMKAQNCIFQLCYYFFQNSIEVYPNPISFLFTDKKCNLLHLLPKICKITPISTLF